MDSPTPGLRLIIRMGTSDATPAPPYFSDILSFCRFFNNKAAVAGVFAAVGIILAGLIVLVIVGRHRDRPEKDEDVTGLRTCGSFSSMSSSPEFFLKQKRAITGTLSSGRM